MRWLRRVATATSPFRHENRCDMMNIKLNYANEIVYGRRGLLLFVRSRVYPEYEVTGDSLRECFDKYLELYN